MNVIRASHYAIEEARLSETDAVKAMFADLPPDMRRKLTAGEFIPDFMPAANAEYHRRTGDRGAHLGAVVAALGIVARRTTT